MKQFDIAAYPFPLGPVQYRRPCLIVDRFGQQFELLAISTKQLGRSEDSFLIRADHPDFKTTGLRESSFVLAVPKIAVVFTAFGDRIGELSGQLRADFRKWYGI